MNARIDHKSDGAKQLAAQATIIADRILVKAYFLAELFGVQRPTLAVSRIADMLAKLGQAGHQLGDRALHMVSWYAFVIRHGLIVNQRTVSEIGRCDTDPARPLAVRGARLVMGGVRALEIRNGFDRHGGPRNIAEQFRQFRLHLRDVLAKVIQNLLSRGRNVLRICLQRVAKRSQIGKTLPMRYDQHVGLDALDLLEPDLVNLIRAQRADRSTAADVVHIALVAAGQGGDRQRRAALRRVLGRDELRKGLIRRQNFCRNYLVYLAGKALLIGGPNLRREFLQR